jgi:DNA-binding MarR family transcriptional regulator
MSRGKKHDLIRELGRAVMLWQDATQAYDEHVGRTFGLNVAERQCLSLLVAEGPQTASAIARHVHLTPAAVTALLDRLEERGYVKRRSDASDRRKVIIEPDQMARTIADQAYRPIAEAGNAMLERFTAEELEIALRFLKAATELQRRFLGEPLGETDAPPRTRTRRSG